MRLVTHKVFTPTPSDPINFEESIEATLLDWNKRFRVREIWFDPFQMASTAQRLIKQRLPLIEYPQTVPNLTAASTNLFDLIQARALALYADAPMRLAISRAIVTESARGWKIDKAKQSHKIDVVVALGMAALAAVRGAAIPFYDILYSDIDEDDEPPPRPSPRPYDDRIYPSPEAVQQCKELMRVGIPTTMHEADRTLIFSIAAELSPTQRDGFLRRVSLALIGNATPFTHDVRTAIEIANSGR